MDINKKNSNKFMLLDILYYIFVSKTLLVFLLKISGDLGQNMIYTLILNSLVLNLIPILIYFIITKNSLKDVIPLKKLNLKSILLVILISICIQPISSLIALVTSVFFPSVTSETIIDISSKNAFLPMLLSVAVFPSILEEMLCRGVYLSGFKNDTLLKSCVLCGIYFGIMHFNWEQFFYATFTGAIFALLVRITSSIYSSIISHFIINGSSLINIFILKFIGLSNMDKQLAGLTQISEPSFITSMLLLIIGSLLGIYALILLFKLLININNTNFTYTNNPDKSSNIYFILSIIIYMIYMLNPF